MLYYSAQTGGFYDSAIHAQLPADALAITQAEHQALLAAQAEGLQIAADTAGRPYAMPAPAPSQEQRLQSIRNTRDALLRASDHTQLADYPITPELRAAWAGYRQALRDLPDLYADNPDDVVWPETPEQDA